MSKKDSNNEYPLLNLQDEVTGFLLYTAPNSQVKVEVLLNNETIWLTQKRMAELFGVGVPAISKHLKNIFDSGELEGKSVISILETTADDGKNYQTKYYNLDAVISVGYRVNSAQATQFRIWATALIKDLATAAKDAGVELGLDYAIFQNHGYKGLYGGLDNKAIHKQKKLKKSQKILDHMGSTELAANLFRATQTEEKLKRDQIQNKRHANQTHHNVGAKIRQTISDLGGTMPEDLPVPNKGIKQLEREQSNEDEQNTSVTTS